MLYIDWTNDPRTYGADPSTEPRIVHVERSACACSSCIPQAQVDEQTTDDKAVASTVKRASLSVLRDPAIRHGFTPTNSGSWVQLSAPQCLAS